MTAHYAERSATQTGAGIGSVVFCAIILEATFVLPHVLPSQPGRIGAILLSYAVAGAAFGWVLLRLRSPGQWASARAVLPLIVLASLVFRLTLMPLPPATSPDVHRYLWEGLVQVHGFNPFDLPPDAKELQHVAGEFPGLWANVSHPHIATIYPPTAQCLFLVNGAAFNGHLLGWKAVLLLFETLLAAALWLFLRSRSLPPVHLIAVLWCPLLIFETFEAGHLDLIGVSLLVLGVVAMDRGRPALAGTLLALAMNVKYLWPGLVVVLLAARETRRRNAIVLVTATAAVALAVWIPYRDGLSDAAATARMFVEEWAFNGVVFEVLRILPGPRWSAMLLVTVVLVTLAILLGRRRSADPWPDVWLLIGTALLLSPVAYPWYFIWLVPGLIRRPPLWLVVWVLTVPFLHIVDWQHAVTGEWDRMFWLWIVLGSAPAALLTRAVWCRLAGAKSISSATAAPRTDDDPRRPQVSESPP